MEKFKIDVNYEGIESFKSKNGKVFTIICCLVNHNILKVFDFENTYQAILAENNVKKYDSIKLVCEPYIDQTRGLSVKVVNIEV